MPSSSSTPTTGTTSFCSATTVAVPVERDDGDLDRDQRVADGQGAVAGRRAEQAVGGADERVARRPDRDRGVGEREGERQRPSPTSRPGDAEVRAAGDRVVRPGPRAEQRERRGHERADREPEGARADRAPPAQPERDRQPAEDDHREGEVAAEEDHREVGRATSRAPPPGCSRSRSPRSARRDRARGPRSARRVADPVSDRSCHGASSSGVVASAGGPYLRLKIQSRSDRRLGLRRHERPPERRSSMPRSR